VQRLLSLVTLAGLGAGVWMFLSGGGLNQLALPPAGQTAPGSTHAWNAGAYPPATSPSGAPVVQPTTIGAGAPPLADGPTIRIASFNIQTFGKSKLEDPLIVRTLAEIVRQFHVVAIQEIRTQDNFHMQHFVEIVNASGAAPRKYDFVVGPPIGNTTYKEQYAFIFDAERIMVDRNTVFTVGDPDNLLHREPLVASFATRMPSDVAFTFTLINVHTQPEPASALDAELAALAEVFREVRRTGRGEDDIIMLGDFNANDRKMAGHQRLGKLPSVTPLVRGVFSNVRQNELYDNLLVHLPSTTEYLGRSGVYNFAQPLNLRPEEAERVSDHFPVWAEFSAYERDYTGRIASRGTNAR
jgi:endonuclease/exonuclease/phosphatase family metal-dependent hydrolase